MWNAKKNIEGGTLEEKNSVEKQKWKVLEIAGFGEKSWKKWVKKFDRRRREKKIEKKIKS